MTLLKTIIPLFIVLGLLQAAVLGLPLLYWRFSFYLNPIERFLFGTFLFLIAFILHPLIVIALITFTIAPSLLSMRHELFSRLSTIYTALVPSSFASSLSTASLSDASQDLFASGRPQKRKDWLLALLGSYVGWKAIGVLPFVVMVGWVLALRRGKEGLCSGGRASGGAKGREVGARSAQEGSDGVERRETGVGLRSRRTDVQVVG